MQTAKLPDNLLLRAGSRIGDLRDDQTMYAPAAALIVDEGQNCYLDAATITYSDALTESIAITKKNGQLFVSVASHMRFAPGSPKSKTPLLPIATISVQEPYRPIGAMSLRDENTIERLRGMVTERLKDSERPTQTAQV